LNDALALISAGKIEIDIRPFAALFGKKSLEQQIHFDRIDGGDSQRIANRAIGRRAAPLHQNIFLAAKAHDVPNDQEITGEFEFLDQCQLAFHLPPRFFIVGAVALQHSFACARAKEMHFRCAIRNADISGIGIPNLSK
jgi:hypothetical protein